MATTDMIEIIDEKELSSRAETWLDASGNLVIVQDATVEEDQQIFVHLNAQQIRGLTRFLNRPQNREVTLSNIRFENPVPNR